LHDGGGGLPLDEGDVDDPLGLGLGLGDAEPVHVPPWERLASDPHW
jgi:hypothetical protein